MNKKVFVIAFIIVVLLLIVIGVIFLYERSQVSFLGENENAPTYKQITMDEAKQIFEADEDDSYVIVDVRRADEYAGGHIPKAINIANESISTEAPKELPDKNQVIYVYCRSGNRSKQAAKKLAALGYTNIIEFGGIMDWKGDIEG